MLWFLVIIFWKFLNRVLKENHATFVETVPFKTVAAFTLFQTAYLLACFGITWIPIASVLFPLPIMLLLLALGPLWEVTRQKFYEGSISKGSELQIVFPNSWRNVQLDGSLLVVAEYVMGSQIERNHKSILIDTNIFPGWNLELFYHSNMAALWLMLTRFFLESAKLLVGRSYLFFAYLIEIRLKLLFFTTCLRAGCWSQR